ncbi:hypothetical protein COP00_08810 [Bacillus glycinifermentans]|nr:hypothetical protein COP00_08810 [Bacillus glycinifermentans]
MEKLAKILFCAAGVFVIIGLIYMLFFA